MAARKEKLDDALWNMHTRIHGRFRNALQKVCLLIHSILPPHEFIGIGSLGAFLGMG